MENQSMQFHAAAADTNYLNSTATNHGNGNAWSSSKFNADDEERLKSLLPPGFHFTPTDGELIVHYLIKKIENENLPPNWIKEVNIYEFSPENLEDNFKLDGEKEMYFFCPINIKKKLGFRKTVDGGYWKATKRGENIEHNGKIVGLKMVLAYHKPGTGTGTGTERTPWTMHEYKVNEDATKLDYWVLCKIYKCINPKRKPTNVQIQETNYNTNQAVVEQQHEPVGSSNNVSPQELQDIITNNEYLVDMLVSEQDIGYINFQNMDDDNSKCLDPQGSNIQSTPLNLEITYPAPIPVMPPNNSLGGYNYGQYCSPNLQESIAHQNEVRGLQMLDTFTHCPVLRGQHQNRFSFPTMDTSQVQYSSPLGHGTVPTGHVFE